MTISEVGTPNAVIANLPLSGVYLNIYKLVLESLKTVTCNLNGDNLLLDRHMIKKHKHMRRSLLFDIKMHF